MLPLADALERAGFAAIEDAIADIRAGRVVVVVDDEQRENEGDLTVAAEFATPDVVNFMARYGRGLICLCLTVERCRELGLRQMTPNNQAPFGTAFTVSIEARDGITTGISAHDRAHTIAVAIDPGAAKRDLVQPGHVFPLEARSGGVLERAGQTEAAVDLARLAGLRPAGVVCSVMNEDGTMARVPDLVRYCERHGLRMIKVSDLIAYRRRTESGVERVASARLPTRFGEFEAVGYRELLSSAQHMALVSGDVQRAQGVLVQVHSACVAGDVFHSLGCDCRGRLDRALARMSAEDAGVLVYLGREAWAGSGLDGARRSAAREQAEHAAAARILLDLGVRTVRLLGDDAAEAGELEAFGLAVERA
jgi:3,4-dihydroxy 2-butanone 4-phosphate synthase/GTP cyclohydrolase II